MKFGVGMLWAVAMRCLGNERGEISIGLFDPISMGRAIEVAIKPKTFLQQLMFGGRAQTFPTDKVLIDIVKGGRRMAPFVNPIIGGKVMQADGFRTDEFAPPYIWPKDVITGLRLTQRMPGEPIQSSRTPEDRHAAEEARTINAFIDYISRRVEWMCASLATTGTIQLLGEGLEAEFDPGLTNVVTLTDLYWADADGDPIADLQAAVLQTIQMSGITPTDAVMGLGALNAFLSNSAVQAMMDKQRAAIVQIDPANRPNGALFVGTIPMLGLNIWCYPEWYRDDTSGLDTPMIPDAVCVLLPNATQNPGASILYGGFYEVDEHQWYEQQFHPRMYYNKEKNIQGVEIVSRPLPVMPITDSWCIMHVLAAE